MKNKQKLLNIAVIVLGVAFIAVLLWGCVRDTTSPALNVSDGIEQVDLDSIYLQRSGVEVDIVDVILSDHKETRKLIVSTQIGRVKMELTDRLIQQLDFDFLKKTQTVSYLGVGYFVVDLDHLTAANVIDDKENKTITIRIDHAYLQAIEIDPNSIIIDEVKEGLLARGDIKLMVSDYNTIEKELRAQLEQRFDTAANGQKADELALKMVKEIYEPIVKAINHHYSVIVEFK